MQTHSRRTFIQTSTLAFPFLFLPRLRAAEPWESNEVIQRHRRATVINLLADGVTSNWEGAHNPGTQNFPMLPKGKKMEGDFYPLLFDPEKQLGKLTGAIQTIEHV